MSSPAAKATLLGLGTLFLLPLVIAWLMYSGIIDYRPGKTSNRGTLLQPPVEARLPQAFEQAGLTGNWILMYVLPMECGKSCRADLAGLRQVRRALGRDGDRVRTVFLSPIPIDAHQIPSIEPGAFRAWDNSGKLPAQLHEIAGDGRTFLIDPLGNIMMHYPSGSKPDDIRKDLERLLKYGKTDPQ